VEEVEEAEEMAVAQGLLRMLPLLMFSLREM
jgi:hypothetical protein